MESIVLSQRGLSYLSRINRCLTKEMGCHFKMSDQSHLIEMLQISAVSPIDEIRHNFKQILVDLNPQQLSHIKNMGVNLSE